ARVSALVTRLADFGAERVALAGGLAGVYGPRLTRDAQAVLVAPSGDPLDGALALALRSARP
ncbi:hypothetical protein ACFQ4O_18000, partial [Methylopila musalis]